MGQRVAALAALAAVLAGTALGAATPVSPTPGARVSTLRPEFSWTLPSNEQSKGIVISDRPDVTPAGQFLDEDVVAAGTFSTDVHTWSPSSPLYSGHYWWLVWSRDRATSNDHFSTPTDFTIPVSLRILPVRTVRSTYLRLLALKVRWRSNVHSVRLRLRLLRKHRVVWQLMDSEPNVLGSTGAKTVAWYRPRRMKRGTRLTLQVILRTGGARKTRALAVRAP
jgi:hypothetical protein